MDLGKLLNRCIVESLGNPKGDPDFHHHYAAAGCFAALEHLGLPIDDEADLRATLEHDNLYNTNFLDFD